MIQYYIMKHIMIYHILGSFVRSSYVSTLGPEVICPYLCTSDLLDERACITGRAAGILFPLFGRPNLYTTTTQRGRCTEASVSILVRSQSRKSLPGGGGVPICAVFGTQTCSDCPMIYLTKSKTFYKFFSQGTCGPPRS